MTPSTAAGRSLRVSTFPLNLPHPAIAGYLVAATIWTVAIAAGIVEPGGDAKRFYEHTLPTPYDVTDYASGDGFYYAPPVAQVLWPLTLLGLPVFAAVLSGAALFSIPLVAGRWSFAWLFFPPVWWDVVSGNVNTLIGVTAILGLTRPSLWVLPIVTKVTTGVGILWFLVRREWGPLGLAVGVTAAVSSLSFVLGPRLWFEWASGLLSNDPTYTGPGAFVVPIPLLPRLILALAIVTVGAIRGWWWTVPVATFVAVPVMWFTTAAVLVGLAGSRRPPVGVAVMDDEPVGIAVGPGIPAPDPTIISHRPFAQPAARQHPWPNEG